MSADVGQRCSIKALPLVLPHGDDCIGRRMLALEAIHGSLEEGDEGAASVVVLGGVGLGVESIEDEVGRVNHGEWKCVFFDELEDVGGVLALGIGSDDVVGQHCDLVAEGIACRRGDAGESFGKGKGHNDVRQFG